MLKELVSLIKCVFANRRQMLIDTNDFLEHLIALNIPEELKACSQENLRDTVLTIYNLLINMQRDLTLSFKVQCHINRAANCIAKVYRVTNDPAKDLENTLLAAISLLRVDHLCHA